MANINEESFPRLSDLGEALGRIFTILDKLGLSDKEVWIESFDGMDIQLQYSAIKDEWKVIY